MIGVGAFIILVMLAFVGALDVVNYWLRRYLDWSDTRARRRRTFR